MQDHYRPQKIKNSILPMCALFSKKKNRNNQKRRPITNQLAAATKMRSQSVIGNFRKARVT